MLYSLATAASTHRSPNGLPLSQEGLPPASAPHHPPVNPYPPSANGVEGGAQTNWNNYHEELGTLFKDDYTSQVEYAGDGWAF